MNLLLILVGSLVTLSCCSITKNLDEAGSNSTTALNDFTDEIIQHCLSFMSVSLVAMISTVSRRFSNLCDGKISHLFRKEQNREFDPVKIFQYYHEFEPTDSIKRLAMIAIESGLPASLSCESFKLNRIAKFFMDNLFSDQPLVMKEPSDVFDNELFHAMVKYKDTSEWILDYPTEKLIDAVGFEQLSSIVNEFDEGVLLANENFRKGSRETRKKFYKLYQESLSPTLKVLCETGDVYDSRLDPDEINAIGLVALADLSIDEKSLERSLELASIYLSRSTSSALSNAIQCMSNTEFIIQMMLIRELVELEDLELSLVVYLRKDAAEIFTGIYNIGHIQESIQNNDDRIHPMLKLLYGIMLGMKDEALMPMLDSLKEGRGLLCPIAAYHKRSPALLLKLWEEDGYLRPHSMYNVERFTKSDYVTLDYDLKTVIPLLRQGRLSPYWEFIPISRRLEYFEYLLDNVYDEEFRPFVNVLDCCATDICSDIMFRKFLKRSLALDLDLYESIRDDKMPRQIETEISKEIVSCIRSGENPQKRLRLEPWDLILNVVKKAVFREVLGRKDGFNLALEYICRNNGVTLECAAEELIKICIANKIDFELPDEFKNIDIEDLKGIVEETLAQMASNCNAMLIWDEEDVN